MQQQQAAAEAGRLFFAETSRKAYRWGKPAAEGNKKVGEDPKND